MTDFLQPTNTTLVSTVLQILRERDISIAQMDYSDDTNISAGFVRYNRTNRVFEEWNGSAWKEKRVEPAGIVKPFAGTSAPRGHLLCDGASYNKTDELYLDLYSVIGGTYGETATHFNVPDLRGRFPLGMAASGTGSTLGGTGGALDHTHSVPAHYHGMGSGSDLAISTSGQHDTTIDISHGHSASTSTNSSNVSCTATGTTTVSLNDNGHTHSLSIAAKRGNPNTAALTHVSTYVSSGSPEEAFTNGSAAKQYTGITLTNGAHSHSVTLTDSKHSHSVTVDALSTDINRTHTGGAHSHSSASFSGKIGLVTGGVDGNLAITSGSANPAFIALNYIITL